MGKKYKLIIITKHYSCEKKFLISFSFNVRTHTHTQVPNLLKVYSSPHGFDPKSKQTRKLFYYKKLLFNIFKPIFVGLRSSFFFQSITEASVAAIHSENRIIMLYTYIELCNRCIFTLLRIINLCIFV